MITSKSTRQATIATPFSSPGRHKSKLPVSILLLLLGTAVGGCRNAWSIEQVRTHLANDFDVGMPGTSLIKTLNRYPTREDPVVGTWPTEQEWSEYEDGPYEPWLWSAYQTSTPLHTWSGPSVVAADMLAQSSPLWLVLVPGSTWDSAYPNTVSFELTDQGTLRRCGHTLGPQALLFPDGPLTGVE